MKTKLIFALLIILPVYLSAQVNLTNRNSLSLIGGTVINNSTSTTVGVTGVNAEVNALGIIEYEHHFSNEWSLGLSAGLFSVASSVNVLGVSSILIYPTFFDVLYYPNNFAFGKSTRAYAGIGVGVYNAQADKVGVFPAGVSSINETVFGVRPHVGIDIFIVDWFKFGPNISYHLMSDFSEVIGERKNYSGPAFSLRFGFMF